MSRRTKIIIAIVIVLLLIALGVFLYFLFTKQPLTPDDGGTFPPLTDEIVPPEELPTVLPEGRPGAFEPILRQLSKVPVAGAVLGLKSGVPIARYQERAAGNVYEIGADGEGEKRLTNTTIPRVYEAIWSKSGAALIARYTREGNSEVIESFSAKVNPGTSGKDGELQGSFLPRGISDAAISPDGTAVFYLQEENGGAMGIRSDLSGNGKTKLWASPVKEWLVAWPSQNRITLLSKPSALSDGMFLSLDPVSGGGGNLLLRGVMGLTALMSPARQDILYSASNESGLSLLLFDATTARERTIDTTTLPEKCAWAKNGERFYCGVPKTIPDGSYPDAWYQGVIHFEDEVWSISMGGSAERVLDVSTKRGIPIDLVNPQISADEKFLIFTDKESGTLWSLQMTE